MAEVRVTQSYASIELNGPPAVQVSQLYALIELEVGEDAPPLVAPTGGLATASGQQELTLTWLDANEEFEAIEIYRSPDNVTWTYLDEVAPGVQTYADMGLRAGTEFWYKLRARRAD